MLEARLTGDVDNHGTDGRGGYGLQRRSTYLFAKFATTGDVSTMGMETGLWQRFVTALSSDPMA